MTIHAAFQASFYVIGKSVRRHGNNGDLPGILTFHSPDGPGRFITVHFRHSQIHQDYIVVSRLRVREFFHTDCSIFRPIKDKAYIGEKLVCDFPVQLIVLSYQQTLATEINLRFCRQIYILNFLLCK